MNTALSEKIKDIIEIADSCPEIYRVECFKILLTNALESSPKQNSEKNNGDDVSGNPEDDTSSSLQKEILEKDVHLKFKQFMKKNDLSISLVNELFYYENGDLLPMYDDLKTVKSSEVQIRIGLLQAMQNAIQSGNFEFDGEAVRAECQKRKAYDSTNFTKNFNNNPKLFDAFDTYNKGTSIKLSEAGKAELLKAIMEIAK